MDHEPIHDLWSRVDEYFSQALGGLDPSLAAALAQNQRRGLPAIDVAPNQGRLLHLLVQIHGPRHIVEIGTLGGFSTIWMAKALGPGGSITTFEVDPRHAETARANFRHAGVDGLVNVVVGDARETLPAFVSTGRDADFIFLDADKSSDPAYFGPMLEMSRPGTVWVVDNVVRKGAVADPNSTDPNVLGVRAFVDLVARTPTLAATVIQTVGIKGHDGFMLVRRADPV